MKKRRLLYIALALLLAVTLTVTLAGAEADKYTGELSVAEAMLGVADSSETSAGVAEILVDVEGYLKSNPIDPATEGLAAFLERFNTAKFECAEVLLDEIRATAKAAARKGAIEALDEYLAACSILPGTEGYEALLSDFVTEKYACAELYISEIHAAEGTPEAAKWREALSALRAYTASLNIDKEAQEYLNLTAKIAKEELGCAEAFLSEARAVETAAEKDRLLVTLGLYLTVDVTLDTELDGYAEFAAGLEAERFECARTYLSEIEEARNGTAKRELIYALGTFLDGNPISPDIPGYTEFYESLDARAFECAEALLAELADAADFESGAAVVTKNGVALRRLYKFLEVFPVDGEDEASQQYAAELEAKIKAHDDRVEACRIKMMAEAAYADHYLSSLFYNNFDESGDEMPVKLPDVNNFAGIETGADGNKYFTTRYGAKVHTRPEVAISDASGGVVVDFDVTTFNVLPSGGITAENGSYTFTDGSKGSTSYFGISPDGDISIGGTVVLEEAVAKGGWTHITMIYLPVAEKDGTNLLLYVDYTHVGSTRVGSDTEDLIMKHFRFGSSSSDKGEFSLDNFAIYQGTGLRDVDYLEGMTDEELFAFYGRALYEDGISSNLKRMSYNYMKNLIGSVFKDLNGNGVCDDGECDAGAETEELVRAINVYNEFDKRDKDGVNGYDRLLQQIMDENALKYYELADAAARIARSADTLAKRRAAITAAESFLSSLKGEINASAIEYVRAVEYLSRVKIEIESEEKANDFVADVKAFFLLNEQASVASEYEKLRATCEELLANRDTAELLQNGSYTAFRDAYNRFITESEAYVAEATAIANAKQFVAIMRFVANYETEAEWEANFASLDSYMTTARELSNGILDEYYPGFDEAMETFLRTDPYFYKRLQQKHEAYLESELLVCETSSFYTERAGACASIGAYLKANNVDLTFGGIPELMARYEEYRSYLAEDEASYLELLIQNSILLLDLVDELRAETDYAKRMELLVECEKYVAFSDLTVTGASEACLYVEACRAAVDAAESTLTAFTAALGEALVATSLDERFAAMALAATIRASLEEELPAAAAVISAYDAALGLLEGEIGEINGELAELAAAAGALVTERCGGSVITPDAK
ncbi:MAG: hypothetical protein IKA64_05325 [Clostridia bacterium]|nr:hypothetical protein [Clostridia bacterium]